LPVSYAVEENLGSLSSNTSPNKVPPETLNNGSPLIREAHCIEVKSIASKQIRKLIHTLYLKAGLIKQPNGRMYDLESTAYVNTSKPKCLH
jgi:hypothetical protein